MASSLFESTWTRTHILVISAVNFLAAVILFVNRHWRTRGPLLAHVHHNQSTVSLVVQLLSAILSASNIYALRQSINFTQRLRLTRKWIHFNRFIFWSILTSGSLDFDLPIAYSALLCVGFSFRFALAPLWAAALAPALTDRPCDLVTVGASFTSSSRSVWDSQFTIDDGKVWNWFQDCQSVWKNESLFANCPVPQLNGFLLRTAEANAATTRQVPKFDTSGYTFKGRSYGAGLGIGMATGITLEDFDRAGVQQFSYTETGYEASVKCIKNSSSDLYFVKDVPETDGNPKIYHINGYLPNSFQDSGPEYYPITTWRDPFENMTAWAALHNPIEKTNIVSVASGTKKYSVFNGTQCDIKFDPRHMHVRVNVTGKSFIVQPMKNKTGAVDPEPTGNHTAAVVRSVNLLSRMTSHLYVSEVGEVLLSSLEGLMTTSNATKPTEDLVLTSSSRFFTSLIDNILSAYAMSQVFIAKDTHVIEIPNARCEAVRLGTDVYIAIVLGMNAVILCYIIGDFAMHRGWKSLPAWDARSAKDLIAATANREMSKGDILGKGVAKVLLVKVARGDESILQQSDKGEWRLQVSSAGGDQHPLLDSKP